MRLLNLTPHEVRFKDGETDETITLVPSSEYRPRVLYDDHVVGQIANGGVEVVVRRPSRVVGLPPLREVADDQTLLVTQRVAQAVHEMGGPLTNLPLVFPGTTAVDGARRDSETRRLSFVTRLFAYSQAHVTKELLDIESQV